MLMGLLLAVLALSLLYWPALQGSFVYDDLWYIVHNPAIRSIHLLGFFRDPQTVAAASSGLAGDVYRPLGTLALALGFKLWGLRAWAFHVASLFLHFGNGILVLGVLQRLLGDKRSAFFGSAVFLWHPVQVQSVAWASQLSGLLAAGGMLLAWHALADERDAAPMRGLAGLTVFAAALLCKETVIVLPLLLWICGSKHWRGSFLVAGAYLAVRYSALQHWSQHPQETFQVAENLVLGLLAWPVALGKLLLPVALRASYSYPDPTLWRMFAAAWVFLAFIGCFLASRRRERAAGQAMAWIFAAFLPFLQMVPIRAFFAERFLYIPMIGLALFAGWMWKRFPAARILLGIWMLFLVVQTARAVPAWRNEQSLWAEAVRVEPANSFAQACYAQTLPPAEAERHYRLALQQRPAPGVALAVMNNLAFLFWREGQFRKAFFWANQVLRRDPDNPELLRLTALLRQRL